MGGGGGGRGEAHTESTSNVHIHEWGFVRVPSVSCACSVVWRVAMGPKQEGGRSLRWVPSGATLIWVKCTFTTWRNRHLRQHKTNGSTHGIPIKNRGAVIDGHPPRDNTGDDSWQRSTGRCRIWIQSSIRTIGNVGRTRSKWWSNTGVIELIFARQMTKEILSWWSLYCVQVPTSSRHRGWEISLRSTRHPIYVWKWMYTNITRSQSTKF